MKMRILFLADPNSIHDVKWINYFVNNNIISAYILPRKHHVQLFSSKPKEAVGGTILSPIEDFSIVRFYLTILTAIRIRNIVKKYSINLINIHYAEPNALWCIFRDFFGVPMVITTLGTDVLKTIPNAYIGKGLLNNIVSRLYTKAFKKADSVTSTSQMQVKSIERFLKKNIATSIIRTGVDFKRLSANTSSYFPLSNDKPYILLPRYIKPIYNHEFAFTAIGKLPKWIKEKYKVVLVGKDGGDMDYQRHLVEIMDSIKDVDFEFIPQQSQEGIFELYKRSSLVIMTPTSDGSPVSGMESLVCGARLILGPLEYDEEAFLNAIRLKSWDTNELVDVIVNLITQHQIPAKLSTTNFEILDIEYNMKKVLNIYTDLVRDARK